MKKVLAAATAAGVAGGAIRSRYERNHFVVEETVVASPKIKETKTLAFLSDIHDKEFGSGNSRLLASLACISPDFILIGGDTMIAKEGKANLAVTERLLDGLSNLKTVYGASHPACILYANGNHEQRLLRKRDLYGELYWEFLELLRQHGISHLSNCSVIVDNLCFSGLDLEKRFYRNACPPKMEAGYINKKLGKADSERFQILMAHSPLFFDAYAAWGADLTLSGHFHGGTIRLPFVGGVMTPQYQFFLRCCAGTFEQDGKHMIVSRGLGTHSVNIRFGNRPQVVVVRLMPGQGSFSLV